MISPITVPQMALYDIYEKKFNHYVGEQLFDQQLPIAQLHIKSGTANQLSHVDKGEAIHGIQLFGDGKFPVFKDYIIYMSEKTGKYHILSVSSEQWELYMKNIEMFLEPTDDVKDILKLMEL